MLARDLRLRRPQDFEAARRRGQRRRGDLLSLNVLANDRPESRYGFVVGRRVGNAVQRNRLKRRLRAAVHHWLPELAKGYDVVVIAHPPAASATYALLESALGELFRQARLR